MASGEKQATAEYRISKRYVGIHVLFVTMYSLPDRVEIVFEHFQNTLSACFSFLGVPDGQGLHCSDHSIGSIASNSINSLNPALHGIIPCTQRGLSDPIVILFPPNSADLAQLNNNTLSVSRLSIILRTIRIITAGAVLC